MLYRSVMHMPRNYNSNLVKMARPLETRVPTTIGEAYIPPKVAALDDYNQAGDVADI